MENNLKIDGSKELRKQTLLIAGLVSFCSMIFFNFFIEGFIITIAVIALPILLYLYEDVPPLKAGALIAITSPFFRMFTLVIGDYDIRAAFDVIWPEIFFYLSYAVIFNEVFVKRGRRLKDFVIAALLSDFLSNIFEMSLRMGTLAITMRVFRGLLLIAMVRTAVVIIIVLVIKNFRTLVVKDAHERHYHNLLLITSNFWSEIYFMEKNISYIEALMAKAFKLYNRAEQLNSPPELVEMSLDVAKEVHEVKKDYLRVIKGLEAITEKRLYELEMGIDEIVRVVVVNTQNCLKTSGQQIHIFENINSNAIVRYHFYMTSVLRNLVGNAIESIDPNGCGYVKINVDEDRTNNNLIITVSDNGTGIKERDFPYIFNPGFSSKYSPDSGDIQRGLGLSIVKGLVEGVFGGRVEVSSRLGFGTTFKLTLSIDCLKGGENEVLHSG